MSDKNNKQTLQQVKDLSDLLVKKQLKEIHVEDEKISIRLVAHSSEQQPMVQTAAPAPAPAISTPKQEPPKNENASTSGTVVSAPIVGTAYLAASPDASPFVKVGQNVKSGDTILIIEAMKNMNEIESTATGTITEICVEDGQPVEFGEKLIVVE